MEQESLVGRVRIWFKGVALSFGHIWLPLLLALPFLIFVYLRLAHGPYSPSFGPDGLPLPHPDWAATPFDYVSWVWLAAFSSAMFFGALGSTVSFFSRQELVATPTEKRRTVVGAQIFGAVFAIVLMLTFLAGLIQGSLFPTFGTEGPLVSWSNLNLRLGSWTKLLVWSFIAGFSERFVPDLLNNLVLRGSGEAERKARQEGRETS